jgi:hypothetical protein
MSHPFLEGEIFREGGPRPAPKGMTLNGTRELISEGVNALEALREHVQTDWSDDADLSEVRIYENMPIEAIISDDAGHWPIVWDGTRWVPKG